MSRKLVGLFGGSFDPVHFGHLAISQALFETFTFDRFLFIPAGRPPHKLRRVHATVDQRLSMLRLALEDAPHFELFEGEILRQGNSYTFDTVTLLRKEYPDTDFFFLIGSDNLTEIKTWHRYRELLAQITLCVVERPGYSAEIPAELKEFSIRPVDGPRSPVSSSTIRELLARGKSCRFLIPDKVVHYISSRSLYRT